MFDKGTFPQGTSVVKDCASGKTFIVSDSIPPVPCGGAKVTHVPAAMKETKGVAKQLKEIRPGLKRA